MDASSAINSALQMDMTDPVNQIKAKLQVGMLKKTLDAQQSEADALLQMLQGKGQNLDIRV